MSTLNVKTGLVLSGIHLGGSSLGTKHVRAHDVSYPAWLLNSADYFCIMALDQWKRL